MVGYKLCKNFKKIRIYIIYHPKKAPNVEIGGFSYMRLNLKICCNYQLKKMEQQESNALFLI